MSANLYLFLVARNNNEIDLSSVSLNWVYEDERKKLKLSQASLKDAAITASQYYITIVLSGEDVLQLKATVPGKNIHRVQQAIPFILEDNVIDDVDDLHFSINKPRNDSSNDYNVSVINKHYFESIIQQLEKAGIYADRVTADYFLLDDKTLFFDGERILFNDSQYQFSSNINNATNLISNVESLKLISCGKDYGENGELNKLTENMTAVKSICEDDPFICLIKNRSNDTDINFLQGKYKKKKDWSNTNKTWMPVAVLLLVWLIVQTCLFVYDYIDVSRKNETLNNEITKIYKSSFPKSRKIIDAKAQMQQKLTELRKRKGQSGRSFTKMLTASAGVFASSKGLIIKSLRYYDGRISLEIQIASLQEIDKLKEQLQNKMGYQVEIQNASSGKDSVTARIQIIGAKL